MAKFHEKSLSAPTGDCTRDTIAGGTADITTGRDSELRFSCSVITLLPAPVRCRAVRRLQVPGLVEPHSCNSNASSSPAWSAAGIGRTRHKGHERRWDQDAFHLLGIARLRLHQHSHTLQLKPIIRAGPSASGIMGILRTIPKIGREKGYNLKNAISLTKRIDGDLHFDAISAHTKQPSAASIINGNYRCRGIGIVPLVTAAPRPRKFLGMGFSADPTPCFSRE